MIMMSTLETLCITCHNNTERRGRVAMITSNEQSKITCCNEFCKVKTVCLLKEKHGDEGPFAFALSLI